MPRRHAENVFRSKPFQAALHEIWSQDHVIFLKSQTLERTAPWRSGYRRALEREIADIISKRDDNVRRKILIEPIWLEKDAVAHERFKAEVPFERSVFIMTKFLDGRDATKDRKLSEIINLVKSALEEMDLVGRIACDRNYGAELLWENVKLHLIGCCSGVAIVEDKTRGELNPNVALEWGYLSALRRPVLFLMEKSFSHQRADWDGRLRKEFDWDSPEEGIRRAIQDWVRDHD